MASGPIFADFTVVCPYFLCSQKGHLLPLRLSQARDEDMFGAVRQAWKAERLQADFCWDLIDHSDLIEAEQELPLRWAI